MRPHRPIPLSSGGNVCLLSPSISQLNISLFFSVFLSFFLFISFFRFFFLSLFFLYVSSLHVSSFFLSFLLSFFRSFFLSFFLSFSVLVCSACHCRSPTSWWRGRVACFSGCEADSVCWVCLCGASWERVVLVPQKATEGGLYELCSLTHRRPIRWCGRPT